MPTPASAIAVAKSRSVLGATELTLMAPLKRGLIPALDARSYETRARLTMNALHALGISRREIDPTPGITEVADAIGAIRSFRLALLGQDTRSVLLSVSFDGGWEPYMRRIWRDLGPLLDLVFCNCEGYLLSSAHPYTAYAAWVRQAQVATDFYYEGSAFTVSDLQDLRRSTGSPAAAPPAAAGTPLEQARPGMVALYRLTDMYPPLAASDDGDTLKRAARLLLPQAISGADPPDGLLRTPVEQAAWAWFQKAPADKPPVRLPEPKLRLENVQGGILERHDGADFGRLVLVELDGPAGALALIDHLLPQLSLASPPYRAAGPLFCNLAFTFAGLQVVRVDAGLLQQMPQEFREGMEARASVLGDWLCNHPSNWTLPQAWKRPEGERIAMSRVHAVVQFFHADESPTDAAVQALAGALGATGRVLAVQPMQRHADAQGRSQGHFGFVDGISQPGLPAAGRIETDMVPPGDLLLGYTNGLKDPPLQGRLWTDSTFLVIRKLRQHVDRLKALVPDREAQARLMGRFHDGRNLVDRTQGNHFNYANDAQGHRCPLHAHVRRANPRETRPDLKQLPRIVRRGMSYGPKADGHNDSEDRGLVFMAYNASIAEQFEQVQSWLSGANSSGPGRLSALRDPLLGIARAGDPRRYPWRDDKGRDQCVDLPADQPLVTLQWGLYAFVPSCSALEELRARAAEAVKEDTIADPEQPAPHDDLEALQRRRDQRHREEAQQAALGSALIARLQLAEQALGVDAAVAQWKLALEDLGSRMAGYSQAVWTAVRRVHGGVLRTPFGVLVASGTLVQEVFDDSAQRYTASGYNVRLASTFGEIYLGRDADDPAYATEARPANAAIMNVTRDEAFRRARDSTQAQLLQWRHAARGEALPLDVKDLVERVLADLCRQWFGLPDEHFVRAGGWHWGDMAQATCPGHVNSSSRYTFQPQPGPQARDLARDHGRALKTRVLEFVRAVRAGRAVAALGSIGQALFAALPDDERLASTLIGAMMGFLPTVDGNLRGVLYDWVADRTLWELQARLRAAPEPTPLAAAERVLTPALERAMQLRPVPEMVWRIARVEHTLGAGPSAVRVRPGDLVALSIVSAMQEALAAGRCSRYLVFGGDRHAQGHPTHACPGHAMAMGVMLGFLAALMAVELQPGPSPLILRMV